MIFEMAILVAVAMVGIFVGYALGRRHGTAAEKLRVEWIFDVSLRAISSPTVFSVYECVVGRITTDKLREEHKEYMRIKEQERNAS